MINNVSIKNYKSVVDVNLPLGRFNLLIGANGCGKSNVLEGIAMGAAASANKLDYEYFANRGMRVVDPQMMTPAFDEVDGKKIQISIVNDNHQKAQFSIHFNDELKPQKWEDDSFDISQYFSFVRQNLPHNKEDIEKLQKLLNQIEGLEKEKGGEALLNIRLQRKANEISIIPSIDEMKTFLIYSLEESKLRQPDNSNRTYPLGRHGEGLFAYLKDLSQKPEGLEIFNEIKENLKVLDWFDDMEVSSGQLSMEFNLKLKDSYMADAINTFDQRSTNEGFLYLLFYLTLVISDETPRFFAIENIDTAFNPKLCREVIKRLIELARKHGKQIIATTHNPAVLDGLDLRDEEQKLMVVQRSTDGYTKVRTLNNKEVVGSDLPLSQLWLRGFIGGLPNNF